ncbi:hypothetical protein LUZ60_008258 [Juncus effusus]|nr:hypothetical protein LUZ60_008258 [Juncus effusus]
MVLIIVPKNLISGWEKELNLQELGLRNVKAIVGRNMTKEIRDINGDSTFAITTYDRVSNHCEEWRKIVWDYLIVDEAHTYKNPKTNRKELGATSTEKIKGENATNEVRMKLKEIMLRRMKSECNLELELPEKKEFVVWLKPSNSQRTLYKKCLDYYRFLRNDLKNKGSHLQLPTIQTLKDISNHPELLRTRVSEGDKGLSEKDRAAYHIALEILKDHSDSFHADDSCNLSFLKHFLSMLCVEIESTHRALVFSQSKKFLDIISESQEDHHRIDGSTKASVRARLIEDFQTSPDAPPFFLLTTQAAGQGITLTKADRVILVDPSWNPSLDNQSVDRAYRIGQKRNVQVFRLITCGTIEELIFKQQIQKNILFKSLLDKKRKKERLTEYFETGKDDMFSLPEDGAFDNSITLMQIKKILAGNEFTSKVEAHLKKSLVVIGCIDYTNLLESSEEIIESSKQMIESALGIPRKSGHHHDYSRKGKKIPKHEYKIPKHEYRRDGPKLKNWKS